MLSGIDMCTRYTLYYSYSSAPMIFQFVCTGFWQVVFLWCRFVFILDDDCDDLDIGCDIIKSGKEWLGLVSLCSLAAAKQVMGSGCVVIASCVSLTCTPWSVLRACSLSLGCLVRLYVLLAMPILFYGLAIMDWWIWEYSVSNFWEFNGVKWVLNYLCSGGLLHCFVHSSVWGHSSTLHIAQIPKVSCWTLLVGYRPSVFCLSFNQKGTYYGLVWGLQWVRGWERVIEGWIGL